MAANIDTTASAGKGKGLGRSGSLSARYPGDMSHRPLDMLKRDHRAADRVPHLRTPHHKQPSDTIDSLDHTGPVPGAYHHAGPYDAALASRNSNKLYSPLEAVKDTNTEAIKATPREYIQDSLTKHVPLQGTAVVPPGMKDWSGRTMQYQEGADLMRDADAPGGAYKRYDFISYHDDDLKGKGETFTAERDRKEQKARLRRHTATQSADGMAFEMHPGANGRDNKGNGAKVRQRSISNAADRYRPAPTSPTADPYATNSDLHRSNTTGKKFAEGLKRRFGSLRRKRGSEEYM